MKLDRRQFLKLASATAAGALLPRSIFSAPQMVRFPEKTDLILLTDRPPQLETPLKYFRSDITPNDAFFVRWHFAGIPTFVDTRTFRLSLGGHVERSLSLTLDDLRGKFEPVSIIAVAQCSGNSRSFFEPRVQGAQWENGAMGNAKWTGVHLGDLLKHAGVKPGAVDVSFAGLDRPVLPGTEQYVKSLDIARANDGEVIVAYAMNDADLPMLNGFPLRLVVPGWFATYWVKSLNQINVLSEKFHGFWMDKAYRIPNNRQASESPDKLATDTIPIHKHSIRSIFVSPAQGAKVPVGKPIEIQGLALDGGDVINRVEVSLDAGKTWVEAALGPDLGKYSWRRWTCRWTPDSIGQHRLMVRATNKIGESQLDALWNRSGYQRNVVESLNVTVV